MTNKVPQIRFPGFDGEWENENLNKNTEFKIGYTPSTKDKDNFNGDYVWYSISDFNKKYLNKSERTLSKKSFKQNKLVPKGSLLLSFKLSIGELAFTNVDCFTNEAIVAMNFKNRDNEFMYYRLQTTNLLKYANRAAQGYTINSNGIKCIKVTLPSLPEQEKIGALFEKVDSLIEGQERAVDSYKGLKKSLLQKMFPNEGEKIPQLRFNGFEDEWEESKLGDLSKIKTGNKDMKDSEENGKYPFFIRSQNILRISTYSYDGEAILIPGEGNIGQIFHYINGKFDYHQRVYKISNFDGINGLYVFFYLQRFFKKHAQKNSVRATVDSLRLPTIKNFKVYFPSLPEQKKIGDLFKKLDGLIEDEEKYLEDLKVLKKSLLQKMFV